MYLKVKRIAEIETILYIQGEEKKKNKEQKTRREGRSIGGEIREWCRTEETSKKDNGEKND